MGNSGLVVMDQTDLELLLNYPLIHKTRETVDEVVYSGYVFDGSLDVEVLVKWGSCVGRYEVEVPGDTPLSKEIDELIATGHFRGVLEVLDRVKLHLESIRRRDCVRNIAGVYQKVLWEYAEFTKFYLNLKSCRLQEDLRKIFLSLTDAGSREHSALISIDLSRCDEAIFALTSYDLPQREAGTTLFEPSENVATLFDRFAAQVEYLQPYFDLMDELDQNCDVLDPEKPQRADPYRRIWLGENVSVQITTDPYNVFLRPDVRFLGPDRLVDPYRATLNDRLGDGEGWTCRDGVFRGLLDLLGLASFPRLRETVTRHDDDDDLLVAEGDCSVCFAPRLNGQLADVVCRNASCEKRYHVECLYEWLVAVNARKVLDGISGRCPNCEKAITCPVPVRF
ncbi:E3 ubiquitin-protein ligase FANCL [Cylas formicarius]|uniref:E3 ubiquitin-protein ligase FANCL n=1 Tax=Cylas formicarius TaxID=197179 RepID=UPI0029587F36|nr:E3 ubiquitin-protein ligase FANCL [Cylas formicarius]